MKFLLAGCCLTSLMLSSSVIAEIVALTCDGRDLILDSETGLLEVEVVNNTLLTRDKTYRDIPYTQEGPLVRFSVASEIYTEGWALDRETLVAASSLSMLKRPGLAPVNKRYICAETEPPEPPEKLAKQKVGKRPRKRGF